jgi:ribosomal protein S18 acetylase RimI-like enzyme
MNREKGSDTGCKTSDVKIRPMEIDDLSKVFHLGEKLFEAEKLPNLYRTWDEFEVVELFHGDPEFCLVAEINKRIIGFALGTTIKKSHWVLLRNTRGTGSQKNSSIDFAR